MLHHLAGRTSELWKGGASFAPFVTSLGKVGGGGYSADALDLQRENKRLTGETIRLLNDLNRRVDKPGGGQAALG